jgi:putative aminopeptidase FrvX
MTLLDYDNLFQTIEELVLHHSPSGAEGEIDQLLIRRFQAAGVEVWQDSAGNVIAKIAGQNPQKAIAITAHKDEIGGIVKQVGKEGRVEVRRLGGAFPWVYGEGAVDLLGDEQTITGILSFGSRHISHESPKSPSKKILRCVGKMPGWKLNAVLPELEAAGIRPGTRMVVGKHRKRPVRMKDWIASYTLDNKASVAILLALAETVKKPAVDVYLVASAKEKSAQLARCTLPRSST